MKFHIFAVDCECGLPDCGAFASYLVSQAEVKNTTLGKKRKVDTEQRKTVEGRLTQYYQTFAIKLLNTTAHGDVRKLTNLQFMLGFSKHQITQVLDNLDKIFSFF